MTRINVGILPSELTREHLLAEHREIKRIPNLILNGRFNLKNIPSEFCLNKGHVAFFYDKLDYLYKRYLAIHNEAKNRNFNITDYSTNFINAMSKHPELSNNYSEQEKDRKILIERLIDRDKNYLKVFN